MDAEIPAGSAPSCTAIQLRYEPVPGTRLVRLTAAIGDKILHVDTLDPGHADQRERFVAVLCRDRHRHRRLGRRGVPCRPRGEARRAGCPRSRTLGGQGHPVRLARGRPAPDRPPRRRDAAGARAAPGPDPRAVPGLAGRHRRAGRLRPRVRRRRRRSSSPRRSSAARWRSGRSGRDDWTVVAEPLGPIVGRPGVFKTPGPGGGACGRSGRLAKEASEQARRGDPSARRRDPRRQGPGRGRQGRTQEGR